MTQISYIIRSLEITDVSFLWEMLYQALYVPPEANPLPRNTVFEPELAKYVQNWQQDRDDLGLIAVLAESQTQIGAAWLRMFTRDNPGYGYVDESIPELSIAVLPEYRGQGIGTNLLIQLFAEASNCYSAVSLSVSSDNPALHLYHRLGFEVVKQHELSLTMKKAL